MYDNFTIEEIVDELKSVRDKKKELDSMEKALKEKIIADGRDKIKGANATMTISRRETETFNEGAFIETFKNDSQFSDELKAKILESKIIVNQANLVEACNCQDISLDYVVPFNEIKHSIVVNVK